MKFSTDAGVTEAELNVGITFEDKLEKLCPHFNRLHALYGERHTVNPPVVGSLGILGAPMLEVTPEAPDAEEEDFKAHYVEDLNVESETQGLYYGFQNIVMLVLCLLED